MKGFRYFSLLMLGMGLWFGDASAVQPRVVKSIPVNGATDVSLDVGNVVIVFDRNMKMNTWSLIASEKGVFPPMIAEDEPWRDPLTFELKVEALKPDTTYAIQLNSAKRKGFQAAEDQAPLPVTTIVFTTTSAPGATVEPYTLPQPQNIPPETPPAPTPAAVPAGPPVFSGIQPGWRFAVTRSRGIKGIVTYVRGERQPIQSFQKIEFEETVTQSDGRLISEAERHITGATQHELDSESGQMVPSELTGAGTKFKVVHAPQGNALYDAATGEEIWDELQMENFSTPIISPLWPEGPLRQGQTWSFKGLDVTRRIGLFEAKGGEIRLRVEKIIDEPSTGFTTAQIRGRLSTTIDLDDIKLSYHADVEIDLPLALGVPFMIKFFGKLNGKSVAHDAQGRAIPYRMEGEGQALQICKPSESMAAIAGGPKPIGDAPVDTRGALRVPLGKPPEAPPTDDLAPDGDGDGVDGSVRPWDPAIPGQPSEPPPNPISDPWPGPPSGQTSPSGDGASDGRGENMFFSLYQEPTQGAFFILIPKGWRPDGGMVPSGAEWNVVDLVEHNIRFRVTSPDGKSFFGWYPRFYFQDPALSVRSSGGVLQPQMGGVLNGCWLYPYMDIARYVQTVVFGQLARQEFQNPRILGAAMPAPELSPWLPKVASRAQAGYVNFQCAINGTPSQGRIYSILYEIQSVLWSTVGTFGWVAPLDRWKADARAMELSIRSFRLNPEWAQRAATAERTRGKKYGEVIGDMQRIDAEITRNRSQARSDMQEEFYKLVTQQIETWDPDTNQKAYLPMYNHAWTNGRGEYVVGDRDDGTLPVESPSEWRKLDIINRNDPGYRPENYGD